MVWYLVMLFCGCLIWVFLFLWGVSVVSIIFLGCGGWLIVLFFLFVSEVMDGVWVVIGMGVSVIFLSVELLVLLVFLFFVSIDCFKVGFVDLFVMFLLIMVLRFDVEDVLGSWDVCDDFFV